MPSTPTPPTIRKIFDKSAGGLGVSMFPHCRAVIDDALLVLVDDIPKVGAKMISLRRVAFAGAPKATTSWGMWAEGVIFSCVHAGDFLVVDDFCTLQSPSSSGLMAMDVYGRGIRGQVPHLQGAL